MHLPPGDRVRKKPAQLRGLVLPRGFRLVVAAGTRRGAPKWESPVSVSVGGPLDAVRIDVVRMARRHDGRIMYMIAGP